MALNLSKRVIALTGGASGIGLATAKLLWKCGASLAVADKNRGGLDRLTQTLNSTPRQGQTLTTRVADVGRSDDIKSWFQEAVKEHGGQIHGAANIAGVGVMSLLHETTDEQFDRVIDSNLRGVFNCMREEIDHMMEHETGSIVNMSSMAAFHGVDYVSSYCAAKAGIIGLTRAAAKEYGRYNIRVNAIAPGIIHTEAATSADGGKYLDSLTAATPLGRPGKPEEVAFAVAYLLCDESGFQSGDTMHIHGGLYA